MVNHQDATITQRWSKTSSRDDGENRKPQLLSKESRRHSNSVKQLFNHLENMLLAMIKDERFKLKS